VLNGAFTHTMGWDGIELPAQPIPSKRSVCVNALIVSTAGAKGTFGHVRSSTQHALMVAFN